MEVENFHMTMPASSGELVQVAERELLHVMRFAFPFSAFNTDTSRRISRMGFGIEYCAGDVIVRQGDVGDSMFLIISGTVLLETDIGEEGTEEAQQNQTVRLFRGQTFGELSLVWMQAEVVEAGQSELLGARDWTARAVDNCVIVEFTRPMLEPVQSHPSRAPTHDPAFALARRRV